MDQLEREYRVFPTWVGVIGGFFFGALLFGGGWGLAAAQGIDIWKVPDPENGIALIACILAGLVGVMLGWFASYADWLAMKRDALWYAVENIADRLSDSRKRVRELEDLLSYVPESTVAWARARREEAQTTPVAPDEITRAEHLPSWEALEEAASLPNP